MVVTKPRLDALPWFHTVEMSDFLVSANTTISSPWHSVFLVDHLGMALHLLITVYGAAGGLVGGVSENEMLSSDVANQNI